MLLVLVVAGLVTMVLAGLGFGVWSHRREQSVAREKRAVAALKQRLQDIDEFMPWLHPAPGAETSIALLKTYRNALADRLASTSGMPAPCEPEGRDTVNDENDLKAVLTALRKALRVIPEAAREGASSKGDQEQQITAMRRAAVQVQAEFYEKQALTQQHDERALALRNLSKARDIMRENSELDPSFRLKVRDLSNTLEQWTQDQNRREEPAAPDTAA